MTLQAELKANLAEAAFDSADSMTPSEEVTYNPNGGTSRAIQAIVERPDAEIHGNARTPVAIITVLNDATDGIASTEIDVGSDTITMAPRFGNTAEAQPIIRIIEHTAVIMRVEVH